jgi:hypothetical protein
VEQVFETLVLLLEAGDLVHKFEYDTLLLFFHEINGIASGIRDGHVAVAVAVAVNADVVIVVLSRQRNC